jgi:hypothetical protein
LSAIRSTVARYGWQLSTLGSVPILLAGGREPGSRQPRRLRQPQTPLTTVQRIQALREQYPRWGREKLRVLLERERIHISAKSIDRVIARLKARGVLREPLRPKRAPPPHKDRPRRPEDLVGCCAKTWYPLQGPRRTETSSSMIGITNLISQ